MYENNNVITVPFVDEIMKEIKKLTLQVTELKEKISPKQEHYDLKTACILKGVNANSISSGVKRRCQPNFGIPDCTLGGGRRWKRATIEEWLKLSDKEIDEKYKQR